MCAIVPLVVFYALPDLGVYSYQYFECKGNIKNLQPCLVNGFDLRSWLAFSIFWSPVLFYLSIPVSAFLLFDTGARYIGSRNGYK